MSITALYSRVSTLEQAKEGYSIGAQKERLEAYAKAKNLPNPKHYSDPAYSGANIDRPQLSQMIEDIKNNKIKTVVVFKLDRLSRSQKDTLLLIQDLFNQHGVDFISLEENIDTTTPMGIAMIGVLSAFAELERSTIKIRSIMGREERAKQGYYHGGGNFNPLGYRYENGLLEIVESEAIIVKEIFDTYLSNNSINSTARLMREKYPDRIKSDTIVRDALKKELYIGKVTFNGNSYKGLHEPIIDEHTFYRAQNELKKRSIKASQTNKRAGLLVGKVYCSHCGARYFRQVSGPMKYRYVHYICYSQKRSKVTEHMIKDRNCKNKRWRAEKLEEVILNKLKNFNFEDYEMERQNTDNRLNQIAFQIESIDKQLLKLSDLYQLDLISKTELMDKAKALKTRKNILLQEQKDNLAEPQKEQARLMLENFDFENSTTEQKMMLIDTVVNRIDIDGDKVSVHLLF